jgi:Ca-activated chloride channel homolog
MDFSFLSPSAWQLLYALPLLLIPYLFRERGRRVMVSAVFLYQGLPPATQRRLWGTLRLSPLFFLQLLILLFLITAAAQPFLHRRGEKVAIVLDTSASMQARSLTTKNNVFVIAQQQALDLIASLPSEDSVSLFVTTPFPTVVATSSETASWVQEQAAAVTVTDMPDVSDEVLSAFFSQLLKEQDFQRIVFFTDRPLAAEQETNALTVRVLGSPQPNLSIATFQIDRSPFTPDDVEATVTVSGLEREVSGSVSIEDGESGKVLVSQPLVKHERSVMTFAHLPVATTYRARLLVDDALAVDNEAYAVLPSLKAISILVVSPTANVASSLDQIPNLHVERLTPAEYTPARAVGVPLVMFHLVMPESLPETNAAFIFPPEGNALFPLGKAAQRPQVTQWAAAHPLTSYVTFPLLTPRYAQALLPVGWCAPIVSGTVGTLLLAGERDGYRYAAVGFDLLPYLGKQNLPTSILTLNLLGWLAARAGQPLDLHTGSSFPVLNTETQIHLANGERVQPVGNAVVLAKQGVYTISENGQERRIAVNLSNTEESQLGRPLQLAPLALPTPLAAEKAGKPLWPWLLLSVVFLLMVEWWWAMRKARRGVEHSTRTVPN